MKFEYDSIMIVVNRFIKRIYFISFHKKIKAEKVAYLFKKHIIMNYEVSAEIIFNKNTQFKLKF